MNLQSEAGLRNALRGLTHEEAPPELWARLSTELAQAPAPATRKRHTGWVGGWALAACAVLVVLTMSLARSPVPATTSTEQSPLAALQEQSRKLEAQLAQARSSDSRYSARAARLEQSLADGLALTDLQLSASSNESTTTQLWQRRVALLSTWLDLSAIGPELGEARPSAAASPAAVSPDNNEEPWL